MVIAAAPLERFDLGDTACGLGRSQRCVPQFVYVAPENSAASLPGPFARAGEIVQLFERLVGPFPYEKLAHLQSSTRFGGMENASAIFYATARFRRGTMRDGLDRARDGASVVRRRGDGARVGAPLAVGRIRDVFRGALDARARAATARSRARWRDIRATVLADTVVVTQRPVIDTIETELLALLNANSYEKGGFVLHMLRPQVGDRAFFARARVLLREVPGRNAH